MCTSIVEICKVTSCSPLGSEPLVGGYHDSNLPSANDKRVDHGAKSIRNSPNATLVLVVTNAVKVGEEAVKVWC